MHFVASLKNLNFDEMSCLQTHGYEVIEIILVFWWWKCGKLQQQQFTRTEFFT